MRQGVFRSIPVALMEQHVSAPRADCIGRATLSPSSGEGPRLSVAAMAPPRCSHEHLGEPSRDTADDDRCQPADARILHSFPLSSNRKLVRQGNVQGPTSLPRYRGRIYAQKNASRSTKSYVASRMPTNSAAVREPPSHLRRLANSKRNFASCGPLSPRKRCRAQPPCNGSAERGVHQH